jgi:hypothetical protein
MPSYKKSYKKIYQKDKSFRLHLYVQSEKVELTGTENRMVVAKG